MKIRSVSSPSYHCLKLREIEPIQSNLPVSSFDEAIPGISSYALSVDVALLNVMRKHAM